MRTNWIAKLDKVLESETLDEHEILDKARGIVAEALKEAQVNQKYLALVQNSRKAGMRSQSFVEFEARCEAGQSIQYQSPHWVAMDRPSYEELLKKGGNI